MEVKIVKGKSLVIEGKINKGENKIFTIQIEDGIMSLNIDMPEWFICRPTEKERFNKFVMNVTNTLLECCTDIDIIRPVIAKKVIECNAESLSDKEFTVTGSVVNSTSGRIRY